MRCLLRPAARLAFAACACLIAASLPAAAQDPLPVVAVMHTIGSEGAARVNRMFRQALREIGPEDGRTLRIVDHPADDELARMPGLADKLVSERPAVIVAMGSHAARTARAATASIPLVAFASLFVERQLISSLSRRGGSLLG